MAIVGNSPQLLDHRVKTGIPYTFTVDYGDNDPSGYAAELQVRDRPGGLVFVTCNVGTGIAIDAPNKRFVVTLSAAQLALFPLVSLYELVLTPPAGAPPICVLEGRILLDPSVVG